MTWEESNEHIGLELIPYKQPARSGEVRGGGRWSSFPGGLEEKSPPCVCMCVCACLCAHVSCLCALYTHTYILELIINLMLFSRNPLPYQTLGVKLWFPGSLELLHQGLCTGPSPARSSFPSWGSPPACRTLSGGYLAALLREEGRFPAGCLSQLWWTESVEALTTLPACCYSVGCSLCASPEAWESLGLETSPS